MMSVERVQKLQVSRYDLPWRRSSRYFPAAPVNPQEGSRTWPRRLQRWLWRTLHRRL